MMENSDRAFILASLFKVSKDMAPVYSERGSKSCGFL